jgi:hypothetical protein
MVALDLAFVVTFQPKGGHGLRGRVEKRVGKSLLYINVLNLDT